MEDSTLLFLDISGYTKLAEKLGSIGAEGTEILSKSISTFFETAILMIYSHGGDVIKFCGGENSRDAKPRPVHPAA